VRTSARRRLSAGNYVKIHGGGAFSGPGRARHLSDNKSKFRSVGFKQTVERRPRALLLIDAG
jgi:hypothetical protein